MNWLHVHHTVHCKELVSILEEMEKDGCKQYVYI